MTASAKAARAVAVGSLLLSSGCGELLLPEATAESVSACLAMVADLDVRPVQALRVDVPDKLPSWHQNDRVLVAIFRHEDGHGTIGFKEASAPHLMDTGERSVASVEAIRAGLDAVCEQGGEVLSYFRSIGGASIRIEPSVAPQLRKNPFIDYIEPRMWATVDG